MGELTAQGSLNNASQAGRDSIDLSKTEECDCPSREFILLISGLRFTCNRIRGRERPHDSEPSRDNLQATPYEINRETCLSGRFLDRTSDANLSESEKAVPLHDTARHLT